MTTALFTDALQAEVATLQAQHPILAGALDKAFALVAAGGVFPLEDGHTAHVRSQSNPITSHLVGGTCDCKATQYHAAPCAHRLAFRVYQRTAQRLTVAPEEEERWEPVADPEPLAQPLALPEAPCSVNVRLLVGGRDCQLTLRDQDEGRLLERLAAVLAQYPLPAVSSAAAAPVAAPPCKYHGAMKASSKAPGTFYCTRKMADGSYCPSRFPEH